MTTRRFKSTIVKSGARVFIAIPFDPNDAWGVKHRHHITGSVNGCPVRGPLDFDGAQFILPLGAAWRRDNGLDAGTKVAVALSPEGPQSERLSPDVSEALEAEPEAKAFFDGLATFYRKNYIRWIESGKRAETRSRRIEETVSLLKAGKKQR